MCDEDEDDFCIISGGKSEGNKTTVKSEEKKKDEDLDDFVKVDSNPSSEKNLPDLFSSKRLGSFGGLVGQSANDFMTPGAEEAGENRKKKIKKRPQKSLYFSGLGDSFVLCVPEEHPQKEGYATPAYREEWGKENDDLAYAWDKVPVTSVTSCRRQNKFLIRRGIPDDLRRTVWMASAGVDEFLLRHPRVYELAMQSTFGSMEVPTDFAVVPMFGTEKLPVQYMCLNEEGIHATKAILCMVASNHSELLCCPRLPPVVMLLLHFMNLKDAFITIEAMLEHTADWRDHADSDGYDETALPYFDMSGSEVEAFYRSFSTLISTQLGIKMSRTIERVGLDVAGVIAPMVFDNLFAEVFPFGLVVRVMDCFMNEGSNVLLRVALALMSQYKNVLYSAVSADDFTQRLLQGALQQSVSDAPVIKDAFRIRLSDARTSRIKREQHELVMQEQGSDEHCQQVYYRPKMSEKSSVLCSALLLENLWGLLPRPLAITDPVIVYQAERDGFNLKRLMESTSDIAPCMVIARSRENSIVGFYSSVSLSEAFKKKRGTSFGDGETFVFSLTPSACKYSWDDQSPDSNTAFFVYDEFGSLNVGAGRNGAALSFTEDLHVDSNACDTFNCPPLFAEQTGSYPHRPVCVAIEVLAFE